MAQREPAEHSTKPAVLYVSKPLVPPWHDGSKNLTRDLAQHVQSAQSHVMTTLAAPLAGVVSHPVYSASGGFAPGLRANVSVLLHLMFAPSAGRAALWHFVFAPNLRSAHAARLAVGARRALGWKGKVVQTIASAPKSFEDLEQCLFGDHLVVLSDWMRERFVSAGVTIPITVIPPCVPAPAVTLQGKGKEAMGYVAARVVLFPGDYEVSSAAITLARATPELHKRGIRVVYACRPKTVRSHEARARVISELRALGVEESAGQGGVQHLGEVRDMHAVLAGADVIAFPVDDLYGKVDVPLVLLEALAMGKPLVVAQGTPTQEIRTAIAIPAANPGALVEAIFTALESSQQAYEARVADYAAHYTPEVMARAYDALYMQLIA